MSSLQLCGGARPGLGVLLLVAAAATPLRAQSDMEALAARCAGGEPVRLALCREGALAARSAQAGLALLASGGAQLAGSSSTLGRRFDGKPRVSVGLRSVVARLSMPDLRSAPAAPLGGRSYTGLGVDASVTAGLLQGFSFAPTVGGVLSLDVFASAGLLALPGGAGFQGTPATFGVGANVGVVRESFTLPGVTLSGAFRSVGRVRAGDFATGDAAELGVGPAVTSLRGVVGKDLQGVGAVLGFGWDRASGRVTLAAAGPAGSAGGDVDELSHSRTLFFGGVALNLLVLQLSGEAGWALGQDAPAGRPAGGYDPAGGSFFLSLAGRLIY